MSNEIFIECEQNTFNNLSLDSIKTKENDI